MESLSELQNPLLDKSNRHVVHNGCRGHQVDYHSPHYQDGLIGYYYSGTNDKHKTQQFLDATSLHLAVEAFYRPNFILYKDDVSLHSKDSKSESFETTFTESKDSVLDGVSSEYPLDCTQGEKDVKIQTVSCDVEEEHVPEYEVSRHMGTKRIRSGFVGTIIIIIIIMKPDVQILEKKKVISKFHTFGRSQCIGEIKVFHTITHRCQSRLSAVR